MTDVRVQREGQHARKARVIDIQYDTECMDTTKKLIAAVLVAGRSVMMQVRRDAPEASIPWQTVLCLESRYANTRDWGISFPARFFA